MSTGPLVDYVNYYKPQKDGSIGGSGTGAGASNSEAGASSSTYPFDDDIAIIARNIQITRDLNDKSLLSN